MTWPLRLYLLASRTCQISLSLIRDDNEECRYFA